MKNIFLGVTIAILLLCGNAFAQTKQTDDEKAIIALMTNLGKAWDARDANKFGEFMTEDCTLIRTACTRGARQSSNIFNG